ncbi:MAG TPA: glycine cleavage system protein GcvH [Myxococcales bacterium]|nr:glycine cleavage system protein GcvH [Myxococcales bacterium]HIN86559.1 glycine cleavage system protein GcvH [Myxococcales bacterium]
MSIPKELKYTRDHEWARLEDDGLITVGVTDYAQESLGAIVYVELPPSGEDVTQDEVFGVIESTKSVSDLFSPITGAVEESNTALIDTPQIINEDCYGYGWIMKVNIESTDELEELLSGSEYEDFLGELDDE